MFDKILNKLELDTSVKLAFVEWLDSAVEYEIIKGYAVYDTSLERGNHFIRNVDESEHYTEEDLKRIVPRAMERVRLFHDGSSYLTNDLRIVALMMLFDASSKVVVIYDEMLDEVIYSVALGLSSYVTFPPRIIQKEQVETINEILYLFRVLHFVTRHINNGSWKCEFMGNEVTFTPHLEEEPIDVFEDEGDALQLVSSLRLAAFNGKWRTSIEHYDTHLQMNLSSTHLYPHLPCLEDLITEVIVNL